ncbi:hypothetical protein NGRA_3500, partial [Nosema granulosis]
MQDNPINHFSSTCSSSNNNMATALNGMKEFYGKEEEDANVWLRDILMIAKLSGFTEEETLRAIILKLRESALSWASELIEQREWKIYLEDFITLFKKRFTNFYKAEISLSKFLTSPSPTSREEFTALLRAGTILFEQKLMNTWALAQVLIGKCPDNIKSLLFQAIEQLNDWHAFIQRAEQVAWLAFPDTVLNRISSNDNSNAYNNNQEKTKWKNQQKFKYTYRERICIIHGKGSHDTNHCKTYVLLKSKGWTFPGKVNAIQERGESDDEAKCSQNV